MISSALTDTFAATFSLISVSLIGTLYFVGASSLGGWQAGKLDGAKKKQPAKTQLKH